MERCSLRGRAWGACVMQDSRTTSMLKRQKLGHPGNSPSGQHHQDFDIAVLKKALASQSKRIQILEAESESLRTEGLQLKSDIAALEHYAQALKQEAEADKRKAIQCGMQVAALERYSQSLKAEVDALKVRDVDALRAKTLLRRLVARIFRG